MLLEIFSKFVRQKNMNGLPYTNGCQPNKVEFKRWTNTNPNAKLFVKVYPVTLSTTVATYYSTKLVPNCDCSNFIANLQGFQLFGVIAFKALKMTLDAISRLPFFLDVDFQWYS